MADLRHHVGQCPAEGSGRHLGLVLLVTFFQTSPSLAGQYGMAEVLLTVVSLAVLGGFVAGSLQLAARLTPPGGRRVRIEVIGLESFMACFGLAIFTLSLLGGASSAGTAGLRLIGAGLSGAAAGGLLRADARLLRCPSPWRRKPIVIPHAA